MAGELGPFQPGTGRLPPYLAGREREQNILRAFVERLLRGSPAPSEVVLHGPRGNGKTALLGWLEEHAAERNAAAAEAGIETLWFTPDQLDPLGTFVAEIAPRSWLDGLGITKVGLPGVVEVNRRTDTSPAGPLLARAFAARVRRKPLVLLLDEAQNLGTEVGGALLNASQQVGRRAPLLLVLAGTPSLRQRLRRMNATFWSRAEQLPIGRLPEAAARDAVRIPLERSGIAISEAALGEIVAESRGYPFFLQLWGKAVWGAGNERPGTRRVGLADVQAGRAAFARRADAYYLDRYEELSDRGLLPVAWSVADAFGAGPPTRGAAATVGESGVNAAVRRGLGTAEPARVRAATEALFHLGYIWRSGGTPDWEPGIPSLMDYLWEQTPAEERPAPTAADDRS